MLASGRDLLDEAVAMRRAVGCFNTYNLEITRAIVRAAEAQRAAVFLASGAGALDYAGSRALTEIMLTAADDARVPVAVHLDHCADVDLVAKSVEAGFSSVMVDGSRLAFEDNVALTRRALTLGGGQVIEAELGGVAGSEDVSGRQASDIPMTDPAQAERFVAETGIASLAVAIGNAHGVYAGEPRLDFDRLAELERRAAVPLVLHGASGIGEDAIRRCIRLGVRKVNVNTEIRVTLFESLQTSLAGGVKGYDVARLFGAAVDAMQRTVEEKIAIFASA
jgi:fructose-bisphosphate aldolase class II